MISPQEASAVGTLYATVDHNQAPKSRHGPRRTRAACDYLPRLCFKGSQCIVSTIRGKAQPRVQLGKTRTTSSAFGKGGRSHTHLPCTSFQDLVPAGAKISDGIYKHSSMGERHDHKHLPQLTVGSKFSIRHTLPLYWYPAKI